MTRRTLLIVAALVVGCSEPANEAIAPPVHSPRDVYIQEATIMEHLLAEYDRVVAERERNLKRAKDEYELAKRARGAGDKAVEQSALNREKQYEEYARVAGEDASAKYPAILKQQLCVDAAKKALGLIQ